MLTLLLSGPGAAMAGPFTGPAPAETTVARLTEASAAVFATAEAAVATHVPEPSTVALVAVGVFAIAWTRRRI